MPRTLAASFDSSDEYGDSRAASACGRRSAAASAANASASTAANPSTATTRLPCAVQNDGAVPETPAGSVMWAGVAPRTETVRSRELERGSATSSAYWPASLACATRTTIGSRSETDEAGAKVPPVARATWRRSPAS